MFYKKFVKPTFDFLFGLLGLILLFPVLGIIALMLLMANKGTPFFIQERPGKGEKIFKLIKFKSMNEKKNERGELLDDYERLTKVGSFIRKMSLDELPQLLNMVKGDMSLIGPRPLLVEYLRKYNEEQKRRHLVKPGITGWAQVNGRNAISWEQKFMYDLYYVDNCSFKLDLKIFYLTIKKVIKRDGINESNIITANKFNG